MPEVSKQASQELNWTIYSDENVMSSGYDGLVNDDIVLMEEGGYQLIKWKPANPAAYDPLQSFIRHTCDDAEPPIGFAWWQVRDLDMKCRCGGYPSDSMMAAWKLHNFDWIQQESK